MMNAEALACESEVPAVEDPDEGCDVGTGTPEAVRSILIVTETEFESPRWFVAEHVNVVPPVFEVRLEAVQPVEERIPDSSSDTDQLRDTSLVYHPFKPSVPLMLGTMTGGVLSETAVTL
jgi:hypothetical protein